MKEGLRYTKVYLVSGEDLALPEEEYIRLRELFTGFEDPPEFIETTNFDGGPMMFRSELVSMISFSSPETRESYARNSIALQKESAKTHAQIS